jgi:hypothetical protein
MSISHSTAAVVDWVATTQYLRQAVTSYRSLIQALLANDSEADQQEDTRGEIRQTERDNQQTTERETRA